MKMPRTSVRFAALALSALALASCGDAGAGALTAPDARRAGGSLGPQLIECPSETTVSSSALVGPLGGTVSVGGHSLVIPPLAVLLPTQFTVTAPASSYLELDIRAGSQEHYTFQKPVSLTLSYARCTRSDIDKAPLKVFYIDGASNAILEDMGGTDNKAARTVTVGTGHLSGYAIGQG
jgi:hypothetical protein